MKGERGGVTRLMQAAGQVSRSLHEHVGDTGSGGAGAEGGGARRRSLDRRHVRAPEVIGEVFLEHEVTLESAGDEPLPLQTLQGLQAGADLKITPWSHPAVPCSITAVPSCAEANVSSGIESREESPSSGGGGPSASLSLSFSSDASSPCHSPKFPFTSGGREGAVVPFQTPCTTRATPPGGGGGSSGAGMTGVRTSLLRNLKRFIIRGSPVAAALSKENVPAHVAASRPRLARDLKAHTTAAEEEENVRRDGEGAAAMPSSERAASRAGAGHDCARSQTAPLPSCAVGGEEAAAAATTGRGAAAADGGEHEQLCRAEHGQLSSGDGEEAMKEDDASRPHRRTPSPRVPHDGVKLRNT